MTYRFLEASEWERLTPVCKNIPNPNFSRVAIAETDTGELAGYLMLQMVMHMEPLYVSRKFRGAVRINRLYKKLCELIPAGVSFYSFSLPGHISERIAAVGGFLRMPYNIWRKDFTCPK